MKTRFFGGPFEAREVAALPPADVKSLLGSSSEWRFC